MIARPQHRPRPIPFAVPVRQSADHTHVAVSHTLTAAAAARPWPRPVHWGDTPGGALAMPVEDPRALYAVTRVWQGQAGAAAEAAAGAPVQATSQTTQVVQAPRALRDSSAGELNARYTGQGSLCVRSSVTGRHYRFQGHGHMLRVDKHDQMLLRRIQDVELV
ncbi:MAG: hypothetical protein RI920_2037 [Pseudomonadota bacterium]